MRDWGTKVDNTAPAASGILTAAEDNSRFNELKNAVVSAGISLDLAGGPDTDNSMLAQALARYASGAIYLNAGGAVNAYTGVSTATFVLPKAYFKGMMVILRVGYTNTGAATINVNSLGVKKIRTFDDQALIAGQIEANREIHLVYQPTFDGGAGAFVLLPWTDALFGATEGGGGGGGGGGVTLPADAAGYLHNNGAGTLSWGALTASNLASPGWFSAKSGHTLQFKGVVAGDGIKVVSNTNDLTFSAYAVAPDLIAADVRASGVNGGTFTAGARRQRTINTLLRNTIGASLASNRITLPAGTYHGDWTAIVRGVALHKSWVVNASDVVDIQESLPAYAETFSDSSGPSTQESRGLILPFTTTGLKLIEIAHQCTQTRSTDGFGKDTGLNGDGFGVNNVYLVLRLWKIA